ncbi:MAG: flagellar biosynthetic protein FliO [Candidatus Coatesbacteria bacterium]|nr:flagellar biosynthetic protein FliO [Candidatus Coatesbacteria bacterium]
MPKSYNRLGIMCFSPLFFLFLITVASFAPVDSWAQEGYLNQELDNLASPSPATAVPAEEPSFTQLSVRMFIVLIVIVGLIILLGFGMRKFLKGKRFGSGRIASVLSVTHIVDRKYIAVVEVLGRTLIVGVGADSVTLLADIGPALPPDTEEASASEGQDRDRDARNFPDVLADRQAGIESAQTSSFLDDLTTQVKKKISRLKG